MEAHRGKHLRRFMMKRKGTGAGIIVMIGLFLMTNAFLIDVTMSSFSFGQELEESVSDLGMVASTKSTANNYLYNVLPMGASYSVHQESYRLGGEGGGITWTGSALGSSSARTDYRTDVNGLESLEISLNDLHPEYREMLTQLKQDSREHFNDNYVGRYTGDCEPQAERFSIELRPHTMGVPYGKAENDDPVSLNCGYPGGSLGYTGDSGELEIPFEARKNRYMMLAEGGLDIALSIKEELNTVSSTSFSSTKSNCGGGYRTGAAKREATGAMNTTVQGKYSDAVSNFPKVDSFEMNDTNGIEATGFSVSTSKSTEDCSCEDTDDDGEEECDKTRYEVTATSELQEAQSVIVLEDSDYKVPTADGWENLYFWIEPYTHRF
jgi:hypothetical protein